MNLFPNQKVSLNRQELFELFSLTNSEPFPQKTFNDYMMKKYEHYQCCPKCSSYDFRYIQLNFQGETFEKCGHQSFFCNTCNEDVATFESLKRIEETTQYQKEHEEKMTQQYIESLEFLINS